MKTNISGRFHHHAKLIEGDKAQNLEATQRIAASVTEQLQGIHQNGGTRTSELFIETRDDNLIVYFYAIISPSNLHYSPGDIRRELAKT